MAVRQSVRARARAKVGGYLAELLTESARVYFGFPRVEEDGEERACTRVPGLIHAERYAEGVSPQWWLRVGAIID